MIGPSEIGLEQEKALAVKVSALGCSQPLRTSRPLDNLAIQR